MRILTITNLYPNPFEPTRATFNRQQLRALHAMHPVRVISPIAWTQELPATFNRARRLRRRRIVLDGITVSHPRYWFTPKIMRSRYGHFYRRSIRRAFTEAMEEFHPDIVFAPWAYPDGWAAVKLAHRHGLPAVIKVHGCDVLAGGKGLKHYRGRFGPTVEALREADAIVAVSQHLADTCIDLGVEPERVRVVYDGIDETLFYPGPADDARHRLRIRNDDPIILFIGQLVLVKGVDILIKACAQLARLKLNFRCMVIGGGPLRPQLEQEVARLGLDQRVEFLGAKPHETLPDYFRAASVFVLPSYSEGVPCVLLEAAACGTAFVASRVGGIPEIAHLAESRLVSPGNVEQLSEAIASLLAPRHSQPDAAAPAMRSHADAAAEIADLFHDILDGADRNRRQAGNGARRRLSP